MKSGLLVRVYRFQSINLFHQNKTVIKFSEFSEAEIRTNKINDSVNLKFFLSVAFVGICLILNCLTDCCGFGEYSAK